MKTLIRCILLSVLVLTLNRPSTAWAQGTAFTYQGSLSSAASAASGAYDFKFTLYDAASNGGQVGASLTNAAVAVVNGTFTVTMDFGNVFDGNARWLEIGVRTNGSPTDFTALAPRQPLTGAPHAIAAANLTGTLSASQLTGTLPSDALSGTYSGAVQFTNAVNSFSGSGKGLIKLDADQLSTGTVPDARLSAQVARRDAANTFPHGPQMLETGDPASQALVLRGMKSQSANLQEWQSNSGFVFASVSAGGVFTGSGAGLAQLDATHLTGAVPPAALGNAWKTTGNSGTTPGTHFIGTTDNQPLELKVHGVRGLRLEDSGDSDDEDTLPDGAPNVIGGSPVNYVAAGVFGATIGGGGATNIWGYAFTNAVLDDFGTVGGGLGNRVTQEYGTIAGGHLNESHDQGGAIGGGEENIVETYFATIAGGLHNRIQDNAAYGAIGGGIGNHLEVGSAYATIGGGWENKVQDSDAGTISGGYENEIRNKALYGSIGGGRHNILQSNAWYSVIAGGQYNTIGTGAEYSTIGGGHLNAIQAGADYATIPGGQDNSATNYAFAAGRRAKAEHTGAFVWADSTVADFASTAADQVSFRCNGGVRFASGSGGANQTVSWTPGSASWSFTSDRTTKEGFAPVDGQQVLDKVASLPITEWNYIGYEQRHIGPMAQEFHERFPLNDSHTTLNDADLHGVALAAIQGLNQKLAEELKRRDAENAELKQSVAELKTLVNRLVAGKTGGVK